MFLSYITWSNVKFHTATPVSFAFVVRRQICFNYKSGKIIFLILLKWPQCPKPINNIFNNIKIRKCYFRSKLSYFQYLHFQLVKDTNPLMSPQCPLRPLLRIYLSTFLTLILQWKLSWNTICDLSGANVSSGLMLLYQSKQAHQLYGQLIRCKP